MSAPRGLVRWLMAAVVAGHTLLLAAYTFPSGWVPLRLRYWSQAYARVLFHQDWRLFAPDPPECGCALQVRLAPDGPWTDLNSVRADPIWQRMCANACRYAEAGIPAGASRVEVPLALSVSLERMLEALPKSDAPLVRMQRTCGDMQYVVIEPGPRR
ncbi:MAG: hypothetical protein ABI599_16605 [Flavobacteriales bacterium]